MYGNKIKLFFLPLFISAISLFIIYKTTNPPYRTIYVSQNGNNSNPGTRLKPVKTIQRAVDIANSSSNLFIRPGVYRESVIINKSGDLSNPIKITASAKKNSKVVIAGSEPSSSMYWAQCTNELCPEIPNGTKPFVYFTILKWKEIPSLIVEKDRNGNEVLLHQAREPDYQVTTDWKYHEHWWSAGDSSLNQYILKDITDDVNLEKGNLTAVGELTGGKIYMIDGGDRCGAFLYEKTINNHDKNTGTITFTEPVGHSTYMATEVGISPYTKYYVEGKAQLLDTPGEWHFDNKEKKLYIYPIEEGNPSNLSIEIGKRNIGIEIYKASNITFENITIKYINNSPMKNIKEGGAVYINPQQGGTVSNITIKNVNISYAGRGVAIEGYNDRSTINKIIIDNVVINNVLKQALLVVGRNKYPSNIKNISIINSQFYNSAFSLNNSALWLTRLNGVILKNNNFYNLPAGGPLFTSYEQRNGVFENISVVGNTIKQACQNYSGCGALKFWGGKFANTLVAKNRLYNNIGWSYCRQKKYAKSSANGLFISNSSGINIFSNIAFNNSDAGYNILPRQFPAVNNKFFNNLAAFSSNGLRFSNPSSVYDYDKLASKTRHNGTILKNNILFKNDIGIYIDPANIHKVDIDNNAYINNKINIQLKDDTLKTLTDIQKKTNSWDKNSIEAKKTVFYNPDKFDFNLKFTSPLRKKAGLKLPTDLLFLLKKEKLKKINDIGPCPYKLMSKSCNLGLY